MHNLYVITIYVTGLIECLLNAEDKGKYFNVVNVLQVKMMKNVHLATEADEEDIYSGYNDYNPTFDTEVKIW